MDISGADERRVPVGCGHEPSISRPSPKRPPWLGGGVESWAPCRILAQDQ